MITWFPSRKLPMSEGYLDAVKVCQVTRFHLSRDTYGYELECYLPPRMRSFYDDEAEARKAAEDAVEQWLVQAGVSAQADPAVPNPRER